MIKNVSLRLIEVVWSGPLDADGLAGLNGPTDRGVMAVYGSHPVFGDGALLYVDEVREGSFAEAVARIGHWLRFLPSPPTYYVGRLGGMGSVDEAEWPVAIADAYRMLVFFHAPPWNSRGIDHHGVQRPTVVLNMGHRHRLQLEISTLWDQSEWDPRGSAWRPYGSPEVAD